MSIRRPIDDRCAHRFIHLFGANDSLLIGRPMDGRVYFLAERQIQIQMQLQIQIQIREIQPQ